MFYKAISVLALIAFVAAFLPAVAMTLFLTVIAFIVLDLLIEWWNKPRTPREWNRDVKLEIVDKRKN